MRGLDEHERRVLEILATHDSRAPFLPEDGPATERLLCRRLLIIGPMCARCGQHPDILVTSLGREVEAWDRMAREGWPS